MGREIRMVPPNWDHPRDDWGKFRPMRNRRFEDKAAEWKAEFAKWEAGERPDDCDEESQHLEYWEWNGYPPDRDEYRPWKDEEATWFQVWETVSEGTPVTPPFATREELVWYLASKGDFWDQKYGDPPWSLESALKFCAPGAGWAPTGMMIGNRVVEPRNFAAEIERTDE